MGRDTIPPQVADQILHTFAQWTPDEVQEYLDSDD